MPQLRTPYGDIYLPEGYFDTTNRFYQTHQGGTAEFVRQEDGRIIEPYTDAQAYIIEEGPHSEQTVTEQAFRPGAQARPDYSHEEMMDQLRTETREMPEPQAPPELSEHEQEIQNLTQQLGAANAQIMDMESRIDHYRTQVSAYEYQNLLDRRGLLRIVVIDRYDLEEYEVYTHNVSIDVLGGVVAEIASDGETARFREEAIKKIAQKLRDLGYEVD